MTDQFLSNFTDYYLQRAPVNDIISIVKCHETWPLEICQQEIFQVIKKFEEYEPSADWFKVLIKALCKDIEDQGGAPIDELVELVISATCKSKLKEGHENFHYILYPTLHSDKKTVIRMVNFHNQVGMKIWPSSLFLAQFVLCHPHLTHNKRVFEVGAGTGITSLLMCMHETSVPSYVGITDFTNEIMTNIAHNCSINAKHISSNCEVKYFPLDWSTCSQEDNEAIAADVILVADCVYSDDITEHLIHSLEHLLAPLKHVEELVEESSSLLDHSKIALITSSVRNHDTYNFFISKLSASPVLVYEDITPYANEMYEQAMKNSTIANLILSGREPIRLQVVKYKVKI